MDKETKDFLLEIASILCERPEITDDLQEVYSYLRKTTGIAQRCIERARLFNPPDPRKAEASVQAPRLAGRKGPRGHAYCVTVEGSEPVVLYGAAEVAHYLGVRSVESLRVQMSTHINRRGKWGTVIAEKGEPDRVVLVRKATDDEILELARS